MSILINKELLVQMLNEKLVYSQKHPNAELYIYNYSPIVQYEKIWNEVTIQTRGLILDGNMNIVALPIKKFFNIEELQPEEIPKLDFDVFEKMDGSLGLLFFLNDVPYIASRGSFTSTQSQHATNILHTKYKHLFPILDRDKTYIFEIIYPENRIVVNYGKLDDLILLTIICNKIGDESIEDIGFPVVKKYDGLSDLSKLKLTEEDNREGYVVKFKNNFRLKVKFEDYVKLHKIVTNITNISIWEYLSESKDLNELLNKVPDEFYPWVKKIQSGLLGDFEEIITENNSVFKTFSSRKEAADYYKTQKYPSLLFSMLDGKSVDKTIWKLIRPKTIIKLNN